jgi:hypothetical protein
MVDWTTFKDIEFPDTEMQFHVDTRDFAFSSSEDPFPFDISKIKKYPNRFFHTMESVKKILGDLYDRSGGWGEWRCLWLKGAGAEASENWNLKYLRIYRTELGFVICGNDNKALSKDVLSSEMESEEILNKH